MPLPESPGQYEPLSMAEQIWLCGFFVLLLTIKRPLKSRLSYKPLFRPLDKDVRHPQRLIAAGDEKSESKAAEPTSAVIPAAAKSLAKPLQTERIIAPYSLDDVIALLEFYDMRQGLGNKKLLKNTAKTHQLYFNLPQELTDDLLDADQKQYFSHCQQLSETPGNRRACFLLLLPEDDGKMNLVVLVVSWNELINQSLAKPLISIPNGADQKYSSPQQQTDTNNYSYKSVGLEMIGHLPSGDADPVLQLLIAARKKIATTSMPPIQFTAISQNNPAISLARECVRAAE